MRAEPPPSGEFEGAFKALRLAKQAGRTFDLLEGAEQHVLDRYYDFSRALECLELVPKVRWTTPARGALRNCYEVRARAVNDLKQRFLEDLSKPAKRRCPYCMLRRPKSFDHFLPIDDFPEYAVLPTNWVYVCERCNLKKGTGLVGTPRSVLNPYFDDIPTDHPLLYAEVEILRGVPTVGFIVPCPNPTLPAPHIAAIAERQFAAFEIAGDMRDEAGPYLGTTISVIVEEAAGPLSAADLAERLQIRRRNVEDFGINGWETVVLEGMEKCSGLLGYVNGLIALRTPPAPLRPPRDLEIIRKATQIAGRS